MNDYLASSGDNQKEFTRRAFLIGAAQGLGLLMLGGRLGWLQIAEGQRYQMMSDKNRIDVKMMPPSRGLIFDRSGNKLAENHKNYRVLITPEQAADPQQALLMLQELVGLSEREIEKALELVRKLAKFSSVEIKDQLSWEDLAKIEVHLPDLPGISIDVGEIRYYPLKESGAHIVGYVGAPTQEDIESNNIYTLPGFKVGKTGIENSQNKSLVGKVGFSHYEVNVQGREIQEIEHQQPLKGESTYLTIDEPLQRFTQERLSSEQSASAVIMDAYSGEIYAMASHPSFDPNLFVRGMSAETWENLLEMRGHPLINKTIAGQYPPASTFKMITGLAALKAGIINAQTHVHCSGSYDYNRQRFHCWKNSGHGSLDLDQALAQSCDTFFYKIATEVGIDRISQTARDFGLGEKFNFGLSGELSGLVPDKNWKMGHFGQSWRPGDTIVSSIGQGSFLATPLQLAVMTARMINGGMAVIPSILRASSAQSPQWQPLEFSRQHLALIKQGMDHVITHPKGTANKSAIPENRYQMGGKTGTAQVRRITASQRAQGVLNQNLPWEDRHHALFVGYAPLRKPRYVCSVVVEHGVGGSAAAAPIARDLMYKTQKIAPATRQITADKGA